MSDEEKRGYYPPPPPPSAPPPPPQYGTFQGVSNYPPPQPVIGFPQPAPPSSQYYAQGYQAVPGYVVAEGTPIREGRLPCCGIGFGWFMFLIGFFLGGIPWFIGAILIMCGRLDPREKPGYVACVIAAILEVIACVCGVAGGSNRW